MGLSGRKVKQRIPKDPRNLSWADDAGRFGSSYLSKFGWDTSKGLGAEGEGRTSHVKVTHKLDMLGIGADHQRDPNGLAWKQNKDFENLLKRLNADAENQTLGTTPGDDSRGTAEAEKDNNMDSEETTAIEHKKKRRKKDRDAQGCSPEELVHETRPIAVEQKVTQVVSQEIKKKANAPPRHRSHRARAIAARNISSKSEVHISEILGIAPTPSSGVNSETETMHREGKLTTFSDDSEIDKITTSTKSVADYFKEKLDLQASKRSSSSIPLTMDTAGERLHGTPRMGLGASRIQSPPQSENTIEEAQRMGFPKFSSLMSSSIITATSPFSTTPNILLPLSSESPSTRADGALITNKNSEIDVGSSKGKSKEKKKRKRETEGEGERGEGGRKGRKEKDELYVGELPMVDRLKRKVGDSIAASPGTDLDMGKGSSRQPEKKPKSVKKLGETDTKPDAKAMCNSSTSEDRSWKKEKDKHKRNFQLAEEV